MSQLDEDEVIIVAIRFVGDPSWLPVIIVKAVSRSERNYEEVDRKLMGLFFSIKGNIKELENKKQIFSLS